MISAVVLFLDVDGVLIPQPEQGWTETLDVACAGRVQRIIEMTGARVVLSSQWRHSPRKHRLLERSGIAVYAVTPTIGGESRAGEIAAWLRQTQERGIRVADYLILDDSDDAGIAGHFVSVDARLGVTDAQADAVIRRLQKRGGSSFDFYRE